jgi:hypothetical protein
VPDDAINVVTVHAPLNVRAEGHYGLLRSDHADTSITVIEDKWDALLK